MAGYTMQHIMADHPAATPVAWFELDPHRPDTAERIQQLLQRPMASCASLEELLARRDLDVILNVTPHFAHAQTSIAALKAGFPVLCEKPPACSWAQCQAMIDASRATGQRLLIHFQHILRPSARWLNQAICRGELGRIRRVRCLSLWWRSSDYYRRVDWAGKRAWQGKPTLDGAMVNQTIHFLNQMLTFAQRTGESHVAVPKNIRASLYRFHPADVLEMEDTAVATGTLDNEDRTEFFYAGTTCATDAAGPDQSAEYFGIADNHKIVIEGEKGAASWDGRARLKIDGQPEQVFDQPEGPWPFYFHVQRVLAGQEEPVTPVERAVSVMKFIFAAYDSVGQQIAGRDWALHESVSPVLRACHAQCKLPSELADPPKWA